MRISLACRYLLETDKSISSICYACGFNNLSNFNRQFMRHKQMTPSEYSAKLRNGKREAGEHTRFARALPGVGATAIAANF